MADEQMYFEDVEVGQELPSREHGPLTIVDTVRWAGLQENWARLHFDRDYVREHSGIPTFIASGAYRQALLVRMITDWIGPRGWLRKLSVRQTAPSYEGDVMRYFGRVAECANAPGESWVACDLEGRNQADEGVLTGRCTVLLPTRAGGSPAHGSTGSP